MFVKDGKKMLIGKIPSADSRIRVAKCGLCGVLDMGIGLSGSSDGRCRAKNLPRPGLVFRAWELSPGGYATLPMRVPTTLIIIPTVMRNTLEANTRAVNVRKPGFRPFRNHGYRYPKSSATLSGKAPRRPRMSVFISMVWLNESRISPVIAI